MYIGMGVGVGVGVGVRVGVGLGVGVGVPTHKRTCIFLVCWQASCVFIDDE